MRRAFAGLLGERWLFLPPATRRRFLRKIEAGGLCPLSRRSRRMPDQPGGVAAGAGRAVDRRAVAAGHGHRRLGQRKRHRRCRWPGAILDAAIWSCTEVFHRLSTAPSALPEPTGIEEYLGLGVGIALRLEEAGSALLFVSDHYFLKLGGLRVKLPNWAMPGALTVGHMDIGGGRFVFSLDLVHPLLGELVHQLCVFADPAE